MFEQSLFLFFLKGEWYAGVVAYNHIAWLEENSRGKIKTDLDLGMASKEPPVRVALPSTYTIVLVPHCHYFAILLVK